jgi:plasmid stabilization system protein ParE
MTTIVFHPEAKAEFAAAARWYSDVSPGLGKQFRRETKATVSRIARAPQAFSVLRDDIRCHMLHRFPYGLLYQVHADHILVVAVMHLHREPDYWVHRV